MSKNEDNNVDIDVESTEDDKIEKQITGEEIGKSKVKDNQNKLSETEKKKQRADRFGITIPLSEADKKRKRAERFGQEKQVEQSPTNEKLSKQMERAKRFGLPFNSIPSRLVKKQAGAHITQNKNKSWNKEEEEKRQKRAERFGEVSKKSKA